MPIDGVVPVRVRTGRRDVARRVARIVPARRARVRRRGSPLRMRDFGRTAHARVGREQTGTGRGDVEDERLARRIRLDRRTVCSGEIASERARVGGTGERLRCELDT